MPELNFSSEHILTMSCIVTTTVKKVGVSKKQVQKTVDHVLKKLRIKKAMVGIHFVGERKMQSLNALYRGIDAPTDVLSFAAMDGEVIPGSNEVDIGDIFLCVPYVRKQAKRFAVSYREECLRMVVHGVLHALGYDHEKEKDAKIMFSLQESFVLDVL